MLSEQSVFFLEGNHDSCNAYKETFFVGVLNHLVMEQPGFSGRLFGLCALHELPSSCEALTYLIPQDPL